MGTAMRSALRAGQREILLNALVNDRLDVFIMERSLLVEAVKQGLKGFNDYSDEELVKAAVDANLGITLADIGLDETGRPMLDDWLSALQPGDEVYWMDPAEQDAIANTKAFHDLSDGFWDSLSTAQKEELGREAGETWPGSSGVYKVFLVITESRHVESSDSILVIQNDAGSVAEVLAHELRPAQSAEESVPVLEYKGCFICQVDEFWRIKSSPGAGYALNHGSFESQEKAIKYIDDGHLKGG